MESFGFGIHPSRLWMRLFRGKSTNWLSRMAQAPVFVSHCLGLFWNCFSHRFTLSLATCGLNVFSPRRRHLSHASTLSPHPTLRSHIASLQLSSHKELVLPLEFRRRKKDAKRTNHWGTPLMLALPCITSFTPHSGSLRLPCCIIPFYRWKD